MRAARGEDVEEEAGSAQAHAAVPASGTKPECPWPADLSVVKPPTEELAQWILDHASWAFLLEYGFDAGLKAVMKNAAKADWAKEFVDVKKTYTALLGAPSLRTHTDPTAPHRDAAAGPASRRRHGPLCAGAGAWSDDAQRKVDKLAWKAEQLAIKEKAKADKKAAKEAAKAKS